MRVLVVGLGELGWRTVQLLAHEDGIDEILAVDVDPARVGRASVVSHAARLLERRTAVDFEAIDLYDVGRTVRLLRDTRPQIVVNTASLQSWHVIQGLPQEQWHAVHDAGLGPWVAAHLAPAYLLMTAIRESGLEPRVVNMAFADAVNPALEKVGLAPDVGAGNVEEMVVPLAHTIARREGAPVDEVKVWMAAHHWVNAVVMESQRTHDLPMLCEVAVRGDIITDRLDLEALLLEAVADFPPGAEDTWLIAASTVSKTLGIAGLRDVTGHAVAPHGLVGGYPVTIRGGEIELDLPAAWTREMSVETNLAGQRGDGIERIEDDGTVVITDRARTIMRDTIGWDVDRVVPADAPELGRELVACYREYAAKVTTSAAA